MIGRISSGIRAARRKNSQKLAAACNRAIVRFSPSQILERLEARQMLSNTIYVDAASSATAPDGAGWSTAYPTLQQALNNVASGTTIDVAQGTYFPGTSSEPNNRFYLQDGVSILGGFAGNTGIAHGVNPDSRSVQLYPTILSDNLPSPSGGFVQGNSLVNADDIDATAVLDGFILTGATDSAVSIQEGSPTIADCTFIDNFNPDDGGGILIGNSSSPAIEDCSFIGNSAYAGGAVFSYTNSSAIFTGCTFANNFASNGGAIYDEYDTLTTITGCTFVGNTAAFAGGAINVYGSAMDVSDSSFRDNSAPQSGGAVDITYGGALPTQFTNCLFAANTAATGAGIYNYFIQNETVSDSTFSENVAGTGGGAIADSNSSNPLVTNSVLWGDGPNEIQQYNDTATVTYSDVQGGYSGGGNLNFNLNVDPKFANPSASQFELQSSSPVIGKGNASALPSGTTTDLAGNPRTTNGALDLGAYQYTAANPVVKQADLQPQNVTTGSNANFEQTVGLSWSDVNAGNGAAASNWVDAVYLSNAPTVNGSSIPLVFQPVAGAGLAAGSAEGESLMVTLPQASAALQPGTYYLIVQTDIGNSAGESNLQDKTAASAIQIQIVSKTIYVDANSPAAAAGSKTTPDGTSWATALPDLQTALADAEYGDQIDVAQGTYLPSLDGDESATFAIKDGVRLYGGYGGAEVAAKGGNPSSYNPSAYVTTLSGDLSGDGYSSSYTVVTADHVDNTTILGGFTITGGGGSSGGGLSVTSSSLSINNCMFLDNAVSGSGGGAYIDDNSSPIFRSCTFSGNTADDGAGVFDQGAGTTFTNCTFDNNTATGAGGGLFEEGSRTIAETTLAESRGQIKPTALAIGTPTTIINCTITNNSAPYGAGVFIADSSPLLDADYIGGNAASNDGAGVYNEEASPTIVNSIFIGNGDSTVFGGGMFDADFSTPTIVNCTFTLNGSSAVGAAIFDGGNSASTIANSILWNDGPGEIVDSGGTTSVTYSDVQGDFAGDGNINLDPKFQNTTFVGYYALTAASPAIDAGSNAALPAGITTDILGNPRIVDTPGINDPGNTPVVDMGAYEYQPSATYVAPELPDLEPQGVTPSAYSAQFGSPISVSWTDDNISAVPTSDAGWTDSIYLSTSPQVNQNSVLIGTQFIAQSLAGGASLGFSNVVVTLPAATRAMDNGTYYIVIQTNSSGSLQEFDVQNNVAGSQAITVTHVPQNIYVDAATPATADNQDGTSWATAFSNLQDALNESLDGDTIFVAQGTYVPTNLGDRSASFNLVNDVTLLGGYGGETAVLNGGDGDARNVINYKTVLSGELFASGCASSSYSIVTAVGVDSSSVLDGFTLSGASGGDTGGAISLTNASPTINDCTFTNNSVFSEGGAISMSDSSPIISNCTFSDNSSGFAGGALYLENSSPTITDCQFTLNTADLEGGAIYAIDDSSPVISNSTFQTNSTTDESSSGGAIAIVGSSPITVTNCLFIQNSTGSDGDGGAIYDAFSSAPTLIDCLFSLNTADNGAGVYSYFSNPSLLNCTFSGNTATNLGGAINDVFANATITNSILYGDGPQEIAQPEYVATVTYSNVQGDYAGAGNINVDPQFVRSPNALSGDAGDLHLQSSSPARNKGVVTPVLVGLSDLDGNPRTQNNTVDMGAYEYTSTTATLADLEPVDVSAPPSGAFGGKITVNWTDENIGAADAGGGWVDDIYLSTSPGLNAHSVLLNAFQTPAGALAAGQSENLSATVNLPALNSLSDGIYYIIIDANANNAVNESNYANNTASSSSVTANNTITWISSAGGDWNNPANWTSDSVPGVGDDAVINVPGITVTISTPVNINSIQSEANITVLAGGSLTITGTGAVSGITPASLSLPTSNLALWLEANQGVVTSGGNQVTAWDDQSGNNNNATTAATNGSTDPTLVTNGINGQPALQFTGSQWLTLANQVLTSQQFTVFTVVTDTGALGVQNFREIFSDWTPTNTTTSVFLGTDTNGPGTTRDARFTDAIGGANQGQNGVGALPSNQPVILAGLSGVNDASVYLNGAVMYDLGSPLPTRNLAETYAIGAQGNNDFENWQGDIAEVLVYNSALSPSDIAAVTNYLAAKYTVAVTSQPVASNISGAFTVDPGASLTVTGSNTTFTASGATTIDGANISATAGAKISLPGVTSYTTGNAFGATLQAVGAGSDLSLPNAAAINGSTYNFFGAGTLNITASAGGTIDLAGLTSLATGNYTLSASGGGTINLPILASMTSTNGESSLSATTSGTIADADLASVNGFALSVDSTGSISTSNITTFNGSVATVTGGTLTFTAATNIDGSSFIAQGGGTLNVPVATSYTAGSNGGGLTFEATGAGSVLFMPDLLTVNGNTYNFFGAATLNIDAAAGGLVQLPALTSLPTGNYNLSATGSGSVINAPLLASITSTNAESSISAATSGTITVPDLTAITGFALTLDATGSINTAQIVSFNGSIATITGGALTFTAATNIDGSSFIAQGGGKLIVPVATSYTAGSNGGGLTFEATGANSVLSMPDLATINGNIYNFFGAATLNIDALAGGVVQLPAVQSLSTGNYSLSATGTGSLINAPLLASITSTNAESSISAATNGTIAVPLLTSINGFALSADATGSINTAQVITFIASVATITSGTLDFNDATDIDGSSFIAQSGGTLSIPVATSYSAGSNGSGLTFQASGAGSVLSFPDLATVNGNTYNFFGAATLNITASVGGSILLPAVQSLALGNYSISATGTGSSISLPLVAAINSTNGESKLTASAGGAVTTASALTLTNVDATLSATGTLSTRSLTLATGSILDGSGTLHGDLINTTGTVSPGGPNVAGIITVNGIYTSGAGADVSIDLGGTLPGSGYDELVITGAATLNGTLNVDLISPFFPAAGNAFNIISAGSVSGAFTTVAGNAIGQNIELDPAYNSMSVTLTANQIVGPFVTGTSIVSPLTAPFSFIDVTFSKAINPNTFNIGQLSLVGPNGPVTIGGTGQLSSTVFRIGLAAQSADGTYTLIVGPDIRDFAGNEMDQNQNGISGEASDAYVLTFAVDLPDLVPTITSTIPPTAHFGDSLTVTWNDKNIGNATAAGGFVDNVYLSTSPQFNGSAILLASVAAQNNPLAAGATLAQSTTITLPPAAANLPAGTYYLLIDADATGTVVEVTQPGNIASSSAIAVSEPALPDLATSNVTSPPSADPGQTVTVNWTLTNSGTAAVSGPFDEQVFLASDAAGDNPVLVGSFSFTGTLAAGASTPRSAMVQIPATSVGNLYFEVAENNVGQIFELNTANNTAVAAQPIAIAPGLTLTLGTTLVSDTVNANATTATLTRNGSTNLPLVVTVTNSDSADVTAPTMVTIPAGQSSVTFPVSAIVTGLAGPNPVAILTASSAGYVSSSATLTVTDTNVPTLTVSINMTTIAENVANPAAVGTVTTNAPSNAPLTVTLASNTTGKLTIPATVTIPAGQTTATFPVTVIDDSQVDGDANVTVTATAAGFVNGEALVDVLDVNVPQLTLTTAASAIPQNGGSQATTGTITFSQTAIAPFQIMLNSSNIGAATVPAMVFVTPGESSVSFPIAAVNNGSALNQSVTITAEIVTIQGGYLHSTQTTTGLTVVTVNGPALSVSFPVAAIAASGTTTATVTRNTDTTNPLTVMLASSGTTHATVPQTVVIPAGAASTTFTVTGVDDMLADGEQYTQISASAAGLAEGLATLGVTTVDLPDLTVSSVTAPPSANAATQATISWTVRNAGMYATVGSWTDEVFLDPIGSPASTAPVDTVVYTGNPIAAGQSYTQSDTITLPTTTGAYVVRIVTDPGQTVQELSYNNNTGTAPQPLTVNAPYHATVSTSITGPVPNGTPIPLSGQATFAGTGLPAANVPVAVSIMVNGTQRQLLVTTDANGNYATTFQPLEYEGGQYTVSADYPGVPNSPTQATFTIVGFSASPSVGGTVRVVPNTPLTGSFTLNNLTNMALTGLTASAEDVPSDINVQLSVPQTLPGSGQVTFSYTITANGSQGAQSSAFLLEVTTTQGAFVAIPINVIVTPVTPQLAANPGFLSAGMLVGSQTVVSFNVTNNGGAPTGPIQVLLPGAATYLSSATPTTLPSLAPGQSTTISLLLSPDASLALEEYTGTIAVNFTGGGLSVPFNFRAISGQTGNVQVTVDDYFTFNTPGMPRVANAQVSLLDPYNNALVIASGTTDSTGQVTLGNVPAGPYLLQVQAAGHNPYQASYTVAAGVTGTDEILLPNQLVTYSWQVVPTEIQDQYSIKLQTTFLTNVPAPVVTITAPADVPTLPPGGSQQIEITFTNHGLIAANNVVLTLPIDPEYTFTALTTNLGTLPAQSSVTVPVIVTYHPLSQTTATIGGSTIIATDGGGGSCTDVVSGAYSFICDNINVSLGAAATMSVSGRACDANAVIAGFGDVIVAGGPGGGGGTPASVATTFNCVKCLQAAGNLAFNTALGLIPGVGPYLQVINNPPMDIGGVIITIGGFIPGPIGTAFGLIGNANDIADLLNKCFGSDGGSATGAAQLFADDQSIGDPAVAEAQALTADIEADSAAAQTIINYYSYFFGSTDWLSTTTQGATEQEWLQDFAADTTHTADGSINAADQAQLLATNLPSTVSVADAQEFLARYNRTVSYYDQGITTASQVPAGQSTDFIDQDVLAQDAAAVNNAIIASKANGFTDPINQLQNAVTQLLNDAENPAVCASVVLQIDQTATLTRDAFAGSLQINNNETGALTNIQVSLDITDANGNPANGEFFVSTPGLSGSLTAVDGTGTLSAGSSGGASFTFIPEDGAANSGPTVYFIGGTITFVDPAGGTVTQTIYPSAITVLPQPNLQINYFLQRDVVGEDPSDPSANIPSEPAVLGLLVTNTGAGEAKNLSITTAQPQIVENEKGLLDTFQIIGTQVGNQQVSPSLTVDLGDVASGQTADADFLLTSSLQGIFTNFTATFTHSDALGGLSTSLIGSVVTHDLVHAGDFNFPGSTGDIDYLVDDTPNFNNTPDTIYFSNGTTAPVNVAGSPASSQVAPFTYHVTASVTSGWDYIQLPDPGAGLTLYKVVSSNGTVIPVSDQAWTTDRSFSPDGKSTVDYELHILDLNSTGSYTVYYKPATSVPPALVSLQPVSSPQSGPISSIDVTFNEPIDASTFSLQNATLTLNGGANLLTGGATLTQETPTTFTIGNLTGLTAADGNYTVTVSAAGVNDLFGDVGSGSLSESFATGTDRPVVVSVGAGNPGLRNTPEDVATVVLSEPIVASSFTNQSLSLTLNGGSNLINSGVTITQTGDTTYQISGLSSLTQADGSYVLTVNASALLDANGNSGVGFAAQTFIKDTTAPTIVSLTPTPQSPRNIVVPVVDVTFSKPINPASFTYQAITFSNGGGPNLILPTITITQLSPTEFEVGNFENLMLPINGTYTFTVNAADVTDLAGNAGVGTASESWVLITSAPAAPTNLAITPDTGVSATDGITDTGNVSLTGSLGEAGLTVRVFDGGIDLGDAAVTGETFSIPLNLSSGSHVLSVYAVDAAGNTSPMTMFTAFYDTVVPTVTVTQAPPLTSSQPSDSVQVTFSEPVNVSDFNDQSLTFTRNGGPDLITSGVTITALGGNVYEIAGLSALDSASGQYQLTINNSDVTSIAGNAGVGTTVVNFAVAVPAAVVGEHIFYADSFYDGFSSLPGVANDNAIATDKTALLPGQTATFANYTSYVNGINGIMVDISNLENAGKLNANDFTFSVDTNGAPSTWATAAAPESVSVRAGPNGSQRIELIWANGVIKNQWLQVTVLADADTGLAAPFVFDFGNAPGESGNSATDADVNVADVLGVRSHNAAGPVAITNVYDFNRDGVVNSADQLLAQNNETSDSSALQLITAPLTSTVTMVSEPLLFSAGSTSFLAATVTASPAPITFFATTQSTFVGLTATTTSSVPATVGTGTSPAAIISTLAPVSSVLSATDLIVPVISESVVPMTSMVIPAQPIIAVTPRVNKTAAVTPPSHEPSSNVMEVTRSGRRVRHHKPAVVVAVPVAPPTLPIVNDDLLGGVWNAGLLPQNSVFSDILVGDERKLLS